MKTICSGWEQIQDRKAFFSSVKHRCWMVKHFYVERRRPPRSLVTWTSRARRKHVGRRICVVCLHFKVKLSRDLVIADPANRDQTGLAKLIQT